eukprot:13818115-Alexandrium_andersonii.AAC.1
MRGIQRGVHEGAVDSAKVAGDTARLTRAARGCLQRTARPVEAGQLRSSDGGRPDASAEHALAGRVCRSACPEA